MQIEGKPKTGLTIDEIKDIRRKVFGRKKAKEEWLKNVPVAFTDNQPIGIIHFGDMHLDADGCNLDLIEKHMEILRTTEGLYGGNLGDTTNNWVGFLAKLYGEQGATVEDAEKLIRHYLGGVDWLYTIMGNHDKWNNGHVIIEETVKTGVTAEDIRISLNFPNGTSNTLHARHNFKGNSQYNVAHGSVKEALFGSRDDIVIHGHRHSCGYSQIINTENKRVQHCISAGSYKEIDSFKTTMGFRDDNISPAVVTVINPLVEETNPSRITVFFDVELGVEYLNLLRNQSKQK